MTAGFFVGLLRWRLSVANALQTLGMRIRDGGDAETLREMLAEAIGDPTLQVVYWVPVRGGLWVDANGRGSRFLPRGPAST